MNKAPAKKLRLYWNSNSPSCNSGYGVQSGEILPRMNLAGYQIAHGDFFGHEGNIMPGMAFPGLEDVPMYPKIGSAWGEDMAALHAKDFNADITMTLQDIWCMDLNWVRQFKNWIPIVPVDHDPIPPQTLEKLAFTYRIIAMSKFGQKEMARVGYHSTYIPHSVDTNILKPMDKAKCREKFKIPKDMYIFGIVGANKEQPPRKGFNEALDAIKMFSKTMPNCGVFLHAPLEWPGGFNLVNYQGYLGMADRTFFMGFYERNFKMGRQEMAELYNCFDMLVFPSKSEGFGVPIIEAQACGIPVVTNQWTSMSELVTKGTGIAVPVAHKSWGNMQSYLADGDVTGIHNAIMEIFKKWDIAKTRDACRKWIEDNYATDLVWQKYWVPYLALLESELSPV